MTLMTLLVLLCNLCKLMPAEINKTLGVRVYDNVLQAVAEGGQFAIRNAASSALHLP